MAKKTNKNPKLRDFICVICKNNFQKHISPSEIKSGKGKVCSKACNSILNGINKKKGHFKKCEVCEKEFWCRPSENIKGNGHYRRFCSKECFKNKPIAKGRISKNWISFDGYKMIQVDGKAFKEHRYIMSQHIGRPLKPSEVVHHIDFNKLNNDISNLQIMTRAAHNTLHFKKYQDGLTNIQRFRLRKRLAQPMI